MLPLNYNSIATPTLGFIIMMLSFFTIYIPYKYKKKEEKFSMMPLKLGVGLIGAITFLKGKNIIYQIEPLQIIPEYFKEWAIFVCMLFWNLIFATFIAFSFYMVIKFVLELQQQ